MRAGVGFAIEDCEVRDGQLIVTGRWSGVRGLRFVRPTLVLGDRQVLADLEHKPWAPAEGEPWTAAFAWTRDDADLTGVSLSVAPSVTVPLGPEAAEEPASEEDVQVERLQSEVRFLRTRLDDRDDLELARRTAERERDNALAQLEEAIADREAAVRSRRRMEQARDEADTARQQAEIERDEALAKHAEVSAHLDGVLVAQRSLQQQLNAQVARDANLKIEPPEGSDPILKDEDPERPIGVREIPAGRVLAPTLHRAQRARDVGASSFDIWAIRILGTFAAVCFILLLVMFLKLFV